MNFNPERSKLGAAFFFLACRTPRRFIHSLSRAYRTKGYGLLVVVGIYLPTCMHAAYTTAQPVPEGQLKHIYQRRIILTVAVERSGAKTHIHSRESALTT